MADTTADKAKASVDDVLDSGQSVSQGDMQISKANIRDAHAIAKDEEDRTARKTGRRPLFRNLNISGVQ